MYRDKSKKNFSVSSWQEAMEKALFLAHEGARAGEVPIGALVLDEKGCLLSQAHNLVEKNHDASAHAEILALRDASRLLKTPRLTGCTLIVTLEPCIMCAASISHFRLHRLVYGAYDPKGGGVDHGPRLFQMAGCLHRPKEIISGFRETDSAHLLKQFFKAKR
nr:nucleoside deaminase [Aristophania vespae]